MTDQHSQPDNIVVRLRTYYTPARFGSESGFDLMGEAADRIEELTRDLDEAEQTIDAFGKVSPQQYQKEAAALKVRIEELTKALEQIACLGSKPTVYTVTNLVVIARAALEGRK